MYHSKSKRLRVVILYIFFGGWAQIENTFWNYPNFLKKSQFKTLAWFCCDSRNLNKLFSIKFHESQQTNMQFLRQRPFWKQSLKFIVGFDWTAEMNFIISESFIKFMSVLAGACSRFGSCQSSLLSKCCCSISTGWRQIFAQCIFWVLILFFIKFSQFSQEFFDFTQWNQFFFDVWNLF